MINVAIYNSFEIESFGVLSDIYVKRDWEIWLSHRALA